MTLRKVLEFKGFLKVILKFTLEFEADIVFTGKSKVTPLKVLVVDAAIVVLPVM